MAVAVLLFASCETSPVDEPTPEEPATLEINENYVRVKAAGGQYGFTYTLTNPNSNTLEAECASDWIHDFDLSTEGEVYFTVDANSTTETRIADVYIKYGSVSDKITVSQSGINPDDIEYSFEISYEIDGPYVRMTVEPDPESVRYYAWYYSKEGMDTALEQSPGVDIVQYLNRVVEVDIANAIYYGGYAGYTPEQAVAELTFVGSASQDFELNGDTEFYGFVCAVNDVGDRLSDVTIKEFKTGAVEPSENDLQIVVDDINSDRFTYTVTTTNDDQYAAIAFPLSDVESLSDEEFIEMFNDIDNYIPYLHRGDYTSTTLVSVDDTDYCIVAFGFEYGMATTEIKREVVHTLKYDPSAIPEFTIDITKVTNFRIQATIDSSSKTSLYYADYCYDNETPEELMEVVREAAEWYVNNGNFPDIAACMRSIGLKGRQELEFTQLMPESNYRLFVVGIDETTGEFNTEVLFTDVITTPAQEVSEAYIEIPIGNYYDGFDLAELYPSEFSDAEGWAVLPLEVTTHGDVVTYYYDVYIGDVTDTTYPTDIEIILDLEMSGICDNPLSMSYCYFNEPLTLIYFSKDSNDNFSPVQRVLFTMTPSGCTPASEFPYIDEISQETSRQARMR